MIRFIYRALYKLLKDCFTPHGEYYYVLVHSVSVGVELFNTTYVIFAS